MKKSRLLLAIAFYFGASTTALANYACYGLIDYIGLDANGGVNVALRNSTGIHGICNLETRGSYAMFPSVCKVTYAALQAAKAQERPVSLYYGDNGYTCNTIPAWAPIHQFYFIEQR